MSVESDMRRVVDVLAGRYTDRLVRTVVGWRIKEREAAALGRSGI